MGKSRTRRALVRGRPASFWGIRDDCLILKHPLGLDYTEVPISHLSDDAELQRHVQRLRDKRWVDPGAIEELLNIAQGLFA